MVFAKNHVALVQFQRTDSMKKDLAAMTVAICSSVKVLLFQEFILRQVMKAACVSTGMKKGTIWKAFQMKDSLHHDWSLWVRNIMFGQYWNKSLKSQLLVIHSRNKRSN